MMFDDIAEIAKNLRRALTERDAALELLAQVARGEKGKDEVAEWLITKAINQN